MDSQRPKRNSKTRGGKGKMWLEDYLDLIESHNQSDHLTVNYLNQIISMHGFRKVIAPKKTLIDAVNTINLMDPSRSTLKDNISSGAFIMLEEAITDLADLNWQECCVTSVQALRSWKENFSTHELALQVAEHPKSKSKSKSKSRTIVDDTACGFDGTSTSTCSSVIGGFATKQVAKRKRSVSKATDLGGGAGGAVAQSGTSLPYLSLGSC